MKAYYGCPVQATVNVLSGKWKVMILWHLSFGPRRFAQVRDLLPGVTEKVLTGQLRQLEADGVIGRRSTRDVPPKVTYFLSPLRQKAGSPYGRSMRVGKQAFRHRAHPYTERPIPLIMCSLQVPLPLSFTG